MEEYIKTYIHACKERGSLSLKEYSTDLKEYAAVAKNLRLNFMDSRLPDAWYDYIQKKAYYDSTKKRKIPCA